MEQGKSGKLDWPQKYRSSGENEKPEPNRKIWIAPLSGWGAHWWIGRGSKFNRLREAKEADEASSIDLRHSSDLR